MQNRFIVEKYTNADKTVCQAFEIPCDMPKEEFHKCRAFYRTQIDPALTWLYEIMYLGEARKVLYWETFDIHGELIKREEPWALEKSSRYSKGGEIK